MSSTRITEACSFVLTIVVASGLVQGQSDPDPAKLAVTPEDAIAELAKSANAGDYAGVLTTFAKAPREAYRKWDVATWAMVDASLDLHAAMDKKFGKDPNAPPGTRLDNEERIKMVKLGAAPYANAQIASKSPKGESQVNLNVKVKPNIPGGKEHELHMTAIKEGSSWKLIPPGFDPQEVKRMTTLFSAQAVAIKEVMKQVTDDNFRSREEATFALRKALAEGARKAAMEARSVPNGTPKPGEKP